MQPSHEWVVAAEEDFEAEGFEDVPWGAIAIRAHQMAKAFEEFEYGDDQVDDPDHLAEVRDEMEQS